MPIVSHIIHRRKVLRGDNYLTHAESVLTWAGVYSFIIYESFSGPLRPTDRPDDLRSPSKFWPHLDLELDFLNVYCLFANDVTWHWNQIKITTNLWDCPERISVSIFFLVNKIIKCNTWCNYTHRLYYCHNAELKVT